MSKELKNCPFCGGEAHMSENASVYGTTFAACCNDVDGCHAGTPGAWWKSEEEAAGKWNARAAKDAMGVPAE